MRQKNVNLNFLSKSQNIQHFPKMRLKLPKYVNLFVYNVSDLREIGHFYSTLKVSVQSFTKKHKSFPEHATRASGF